ncbi:MULTISPECIES: helix-turn-helix transcriptional regulator [unclassified Pseudomonas]|uniref:helix-turn-helix transcriptional regulator n=1 Tax=unclassified Pseudomonas TaxID=196821 RepID=UPI00129E0AF9|nr:MULTISPECIES: helix-turn-helix transcriptional regulator [unclassified Pseudomonas]MDH4651396.1 helix-turn-helix transcriptional regulator [Pseudomonas sp. BN606]MRK23277.1 helix-turn-helix transcriptional regulator [Pseudomonas sp. JG-B]
MPKPNMQTNYDELVSLCYACVLDEAKWRELLNSLMQASGRQQGGLLIQSGHSSFGQISEISCFDPAIVGPYNEYYCHLDPGRMYVPNQPVGRWYHDFVDYGVEAIRHSPYYQEFHRYCGLGNITSVKLYETSSSKAFLSLLTNWDTQLPNDRQQSLLNRLSPHLTTAGRLSERIQSLELQLAKRDLLLDQHTAPLWLVDSESRVVYCNQSATQRMSQVGFALHETFGRLHCAHHEASLQAQVRQASGKSGPQRAGWLRLTGPHAGDLLITPVPADAPFNRYFQKPLVLLALLDNQPQSQLLADIFHLSPAEKRLAELLAQGNTPDACAERLNVSINTVRTQLRTLFRKTDTSRQADLVKLFARLRRG